MAGASVSPPVPFAADGVSPPGSAGPRGIVRTCHHRPVLGLLGSSGPPATVGDVIAADVGDGVIDNIIISSATHRWWGLLTLVVLAATVALLTWDVGKGRAATRTTRWSFLAAQVVLVGQALLGIKLLDQGQGIVQLYIHYIGGLIPLGAFLAGGWLARGDTPRSARLLLILLVVGLASGVMAFTIGQAYVNG